ncbi:metal ABC transporter solute-binding protein, Zn/Mn family [Prevotella sp.]|uniref:metal ABC transporter solute-binding protein, Zn/Mn family n=1 Tax=Prevotella sp. TaxID=59823 RepID=UPI00264A40BD|nr:zinc ABC transporter substrate-binding protein [Prevotella sp.]MDN5553361.1 zinc ABC transporter substrate-binding protein [Prevotella sp.]
MDAIIDFLINWGYWGILIAAFLAGSILPFSSEAVMLGLLAAGLKPWPLIIYGTIGNVLGSMFNYAIGHLGRVDWIEKYLHIKPKSLEKAQRFMEGRGAWMGFFSFIPVVGDAIPIVLGLMRSNLTISIISITLGKALRYIVLVSSVLSLTSCISPSKNNQRMITVTIEPLRYFTEQIAGNKFDVVTMVPNGSSPETYEPTARQMVKLSGSDLYIKVGNIGFERTWMKKLESNAPHTIIINSSEGITLQKNENGVTDPHVWMSTSNAKIIARNIYKALSEIDSKDSIYFKNNLTKLLEKIEITNINVRECISKNKTLTFLVYHPALTYFARDYGLKQIPIEEEGREPSAAQLQQTISAAKQKKVKVLFVQKEFANRNTEIVEEGTNAKKVEINPLSYNWNKEMEDIAKKLK